MRHFRLPIWVIPLALAGLVAVLGWWGNQRLRETINAEVRADLQATLDANVTALEIWATNQMRLASSLAGEPALRSLALQVLASTPARGAEAGSGNVEAALEMSRYLRGRLEGLGYEIAHLVDTNYLVASTSIAAAAAEPRLAISDMHLAKFSELFSKGQPVIITPFRARGEAGKSEQAEPPPPSPAPAQTNDTETATNAVAVARPRSDTLMQVAVPVHDLEGKVRGALALVIDADREFTRILSVARAGESGETYVFDQHGMMLSRSRFEAQLRELGLIDNRPGVNSAATFRLVDPGPFETESPGEVGSETVRRPLIWIVANAVAGGSGVDVHPARDYRGVPVVGAWRWLPRHGFGVATQLDASEAFNPLRVLNWLFAMLFLLLALFATALFLASYLGALWRRRLTEAELRLKQLGQYTLEDKIGEGAMGTVYRARHALMRRETAVKLLLPDRADPLSIKRFEHEVQLSCQLAHPNTIQVYDYGHTPDGVFYYAMELLKGLNLKQLVSQFGPQPEARVIYIMSQVSEALTEAHALGLVHRDIKPANIFLCDRSGLHDWVKVLDFGLVRAYRSGRGNRERTLPAVAEGTPLFMPPEAFADSGAADPRSDIYSLGALGYYLLTGQYLFEAESDSELYHKHLSESPIPPSRRTDHAVSAEMDETLLRCLEKEPNLRVQSAAELRELLLTSPVSSKWGAEERVAWWTAYRSGNGTLPVLTQRTAEREEGTVRIHIPRETAAKEA
jgi:eukaryotic-like serine/threonine-protein kinase